MVCVTSDKDINYIFGQFYEGLYTSKSIAGARGIQEFLVKCKLPILDQHDRDETLKLHVKKY